MVYMLNDNCLWSISIQFYYAYTHGEKGAKFYSSKRSIFAVRIHDVNGLSFVLKQWIVMHICSLLLPCFSLTNLSQGTINCVWTTHHLISLLLIKRRSESVCAWVDVPRSVFWGGIGLCFFCDRTGPYGRTDAWTDGRTNKRTYLLLFVFFGFFCRIFLPFSEIN